MHEFQRSMSVRTKRGPNDISPSVLRKYSYELALILINSTLNALRLASFLNLGGICEYLTVTKEK